MIDEKCIYYYKGFYLKGMVGTICELDDCVAHTIKTDKV